MKKGLFASAHEKTLDITEKEIMSLTNMPMDEMNKEIILEAYQAVIQEDDTIKNCKRDIANRLLESNWLWEIKTKEGIKRFVDGCISKKCAIVKNGTNMRFHITPEKINIGAGKELEDIDLLKSLKTGYKIIDANGDEFRLIGIMPDRDIIVFKIG